MTQDERIAELEKLMRELMRELKPEVIGRLHALESDVRELKARTASQVRYGPIPGQGYTPSGPAIDFGKLKPPTGGTCIDRPQEHKGK